MKTKISKLLTVVLMSFLVTSFFACSKNKDGLPSTKEHKIVYKIIASAGVNITGVVYGYDEDLITRTSISGTTWQSEELTAPKGTVQAGIQSSGLGPDANATLRVEIWVDGAKVKEGISSGSALAASAFYKF